MFVIENWDRSSCLCEYATCLLEDVAARVDMLACNNNRIRDKRSHKNS